MCPLDVASYTLKSIFCNRFLREVFSEASEDHRGKRLFPGVSSLTLALATAAAAQPRASLAATCSTHFFFLALNPGHLKLHLITSLSLSLYLITPSPSSSPPPRCLSLKISWFEEAKKMAPTCLTLTLVRRWVLFFSGSIFYFFFLRLGILP